MKIDTIVSDIFETGIDFDTINDNIIDCILDIGGLNDFSDSDMLSICMKTMSKSHQIFNFVN